MTIKVTFEFPTMEALRDFTLQTATPLNAVGVDNGKAAAVTVEPIPPAGTQVTVGASTKKPTKPKSKTKPAAKPAQKDPLMPETAAPPAGKPAEQPAEKEPTIDEVRAVLMEYNSKKGLTAMGKKMKEEFGCNSMRGLKKSQYADVIRAFKL